MTIKEQFTEVMLEVRERVLDAADADPDTELGRVLDAAISDAVDRCGNLASVRYGVPPGVAPIRAKVTQYTPSLERDKDGDLRPIRVALEVQNTHPNLLALAELDGAVTIMPHQLRLTEEAPAPTEGDGPTDEAVAPQLQLDDVVPEPTDEEEAFADAYFKGYDALSHNEKAKNPFKEKDEPMAHRAWAAGFRQAGQGKPWCVDVAWEGSYHAQGYAAHGAATQNENPYQAGSPAHEAWNKGYAFAEQEWTRIHGEEAEAAEGDADAAEGDAEMEEVEV